MQQHNTGPQARRRIVSLSAGLKRSLPAAAVALMLATLSPLGQAAQLRMSPDTRIQDLGSADPTEVHDITIALKVPNLAALKSFVASTIDPSSPNYHQFLSPDQFAAQYGQSPDVVAQVSAYLQSMGLTVTDVNPNNLLISATGTNAQIASAFGTAIHLYAQDGNNYQAASGAPVLPAAIAGVVNSIEGISTKPLMRSNQQSLPNTGPSAAEATAAPAVTPTPGAPATNTPGSYTAADLVKQYNVQPLYNKGLNGAGRTIGIATLAGYTASDVFGYWAALGLSVDPNRITNVNVDGGYSKGYGPGSSGAQETTLDIEQSGAIAPGAKMRVYIAPNTSKGFLDVFAKAVKDNLVDTLSISWGGIEIGYSSTASFDQVFLQAAAQGIPVIASAGDSGAYDINRSPGSYTYPSNCTTLLSVDFPAASPMVLAAGGTTLPGAYVRSRGTVTVPSERPWGWDYLYSYMVSNYGQATYYNSYFPVGGGGGVSVMYGVPDYQAGLSGVMTSAPAQSLFCSPAVTKTSSWQDWADMPAGFAGRNVPDVSLNADPVSGYSVYVGGAWQLGWGGTSFVSPQLNGIFTLVSQGAGSRLGQLQPQLYATFRRMGYGTGSPFRAITSGSNLYYQAGSHYNPATGLGSLDVSNLAKSFGAL